MKKAFITGITGQDGSYLAELLLAKGYAVHGLVRRASAYNRSRIDHLRTDENVGSGRLVLHYGELNDVTSFHRLLHKIEPAEIYHLAGQSHVGLSFELPEVTCLENGMATLHLLESMRELDTSTRLYLAQSSEIFGAPEGEDPQDETTPVAPRNPYGCAKVFSMQLGKVYRESHGLFVCNGIAFNHESPRRGENFVTRKISMGAARIAAGDEAVIELGNLDGRRDWGYAPEYVEAMWRMLQQDRADDFVLATGRTHTVREFAAAAFAAVGVPVDFQGQGVEEVARRRDNGAIVLRVSPRYFRPVDAVSLRGNPAKAKAELGWKAQTQGADLAALMVEAERG
ncbi:GDP-mannose 4,6-dehydratase [Actomonas aquatica]|uniref:GDP-mannose 4,6-dehydratase n=1 Tax=Actomonas aquatica TaxID=2866162 RepID=A0ABZ1CB31_9BACT|nr:GDP-mannose 4,6-dehydratase [Opitutus sp. WL0086]WRQ88607.1 GDP-mannose 4,6-dehydratase [Opitutus sp. WL0086]